MLATCPICFKSYPPALLERHVNSCLDNLEDVHPVEGEETLIAKSSDLEDVSIVGSTQISDPSRHGNSNAFAALGLKIDSSGQKRKDSAKKNVKEKPTLTSILIAERRLKRKQEELEQLEKESLGTTSKRVKSESDHVTQPITQPQTPSAPQTPVIHQSSTGNTSPLSSPPKSEILRKSQELMKLRKESSLPLAQRLRPKSLDDFFGQEKLVGPNGILRNIINTDQIPSFILWGVPGVGKTSLARIIASSSSYKFVEVSGADSNAKKLKEAFANAENEKHLTGRKTILFLDEIHRFNKAVQDLLLPVVERGVVTVIGATTENPSFTLNNALLSRMHTFVMEPLPHHALVKIINRGLLIVNKTRHLIHKLHLIALNKEAIDHIAKLSTGDSRVALNILESINAYLSGLKYQEFTELEDAEQGLSQAANGEIGIIKINLENLTPLLSTKNYHQMYDKQGESHYDTISAFHKSVRGSNADAALFYLAKMLSGGEDPLFIVRRMIVIASEDIGVRDSSMLPFMISALEALKFVGMPEGQIILAHCAVKLARSLKSTKSYRGLNSALGLLKENPEITRLPIPLHLRNAPTKLMKELGYGEDYKYNPNYKYGKNKQLYFPLELGEKTKFLEETHLGTVEDTAVEKAEYEKLLKEDQTYQEFKKFQRQKSKDRQKVQRLKSRLENEHRVEDATDNDEETTNKYSYDEFLSKEDQPDFFDGAEKDEYSDDPDCSHNFDNSYDEFANGEENKYLFHNE